MEYDYNAIKLAFIGVSNWPFDASKMNRGIHLSIPEPNKEDLTKTSIAIAESFDIRLTQDYMKYFEYLANTYFDYKKELRNSPEKFEINPIDSSSNVINNMKEFHGTRDFYYLIKIVCKLFIENGFTNDQDKIYSILNESIERNFGGLDNSIKLFKAKLKKYVPSIEDEQKYDVMNCIANNIQDSKSRYILVETKSSISEYLITLILNMLDKKYIFYIGSNFKEDNSKAYYTAKILNKIQVTMEYDNVMILNNLTSVYPSLYDLLNLNFRRIGRDNYARIALADSNTQNYRVNNDFRCVILLDKNNITNQDSPFLNRLEKHIISFEYLLTKKQIEFSNTIFNIIEGITHGTNLKIDLKSELINFDLEQIHGIIYKFLLIDENKEHNNTNEVYENNYDNDKNNDMNINDDENKNKYEFSFDDDDNNNDELFDHYHDINKEKKKLTMKIESNHSIEEFKKIVFSTIIPTFSQDLIFYAKNSEYGKQHKEEMNKILNIYLNDENLHKNLKTYLENITSEKHIIYTFSNILESIFGARNEIKSIDNNTYGSFEKKTTKNIFINEYNSERTIEEEIVDFYSNSTHNLCILHFDREDYIHLKHINFLIENNENISKGNNHKNSKVILFIIHLKRSLLLNNKGKSNENQQIVMKNEYLISHLTQWKQFFIDNLNGTDIRINEIINASNIELFKNKSLIDIDKEFENNLYISFSYIKPIFKVNFSNVKDEETYIQVVCEYINSHEDFKLEIQNLVLKIIENINEKILTKVFRENKFEENDVDFISIIVKYMKYIYKHSLIKILLQLQQNNIISTKIINKPLVIENFNYKVKKYENFDFIFEKYPDLDRKEIVILLGISSPYIIDKFKDIINYVNKGKLKEDYCEVNIDIIKYSENVDEYAMEIQRLENNIVVEFKRTFDEIFEDNKNNGNIKLDILFTDYCIYYLSKSNSQFSNPNVIKFFNILYSLFVFYNIDRKYENDGNLKYTLEDIAKFVLFIETYQTYIFSLCEFICSMDEFYSKFLDNYITILDKEMLEINTNNKIYDLFFNLYESAVYSILCINQDIFLNEKFLDEIKSFADNTMKINIEMGLTLKQILYLFDFIHVKDVFIKCGVSLKENLKHYLKYLKKESVTILISKEFNINNNDSNNIKAILEEEFNYLKGILPYDEFSNLITKLINNKIKISKRKEYRKLLLEKLCSDSQYIYKSKNIFELIFKPFHICPKNKTRKIEKEEEKMKLKNKKKDEKRKKMNIFMDEDDRNDADEFKETINGTNLEEKEKEHEMNDLEDDNTETVSKDEDESKESNYDEENEEKENEEEEEEEDDDDDDDDDDDEEDDDHNYGIKFLQELEYERNDLIIKFLNKTQNIYVDEVLLSLFDEKINNYFQKKRSEKYKLFNQSLSILKYCINYIESNQCQFTNTNKIGILYCISYIKYYCYNLCKFIYECYVKANDDKVNKNMNADDEEEIENLQILIKNEIIDYLDGESKLKKVIKIYILRVLNKIFFGNYKKLLNFINKTELFIDDFNFTENSPRSLNHLFLQNETFKEYENLRKMYMNCKMEYFKPFDEFVKMMNHNQLLRFYDLMINEEISNFNLNSNKDYQDKLKIFIEKILNEFELPSPPKEIISMNFDIKSLTKQLKSIKNIDTIEAYEIMFYSRKFAFICSLAKPNSIYHQILSENFIDNIKNIYIPGGEIKFNIKIESAYEIQKYLNAGGKYATFMCECGNWYQIADCGGAVTENDCPICRKKIGGKGYKLNRSSVRICLNGNQVANVQCKSLDQLMKEVQDFISKPFKGHAKLFKRFS